MALYYYKCRANVPLATGVPITDLKPSRPTFGRLGTEGNYVLLAKLNDLLRQGAKNIASQLLIVAIHIIKII